MSDFVLVAMRGDGSDPVELMVGSLDGILSDRAMELLLINQLMPAQITIAPLRSSR